MSSRQDRFIVDASERVVDIADDTVTGQHGPIPIRRYRPRGAAASTAHLVWLHGGAFSHGGLDQLESHAVAAALAARGTPVTAIDYRLVPAWRWYRDAPDSPLTGVRFPVPQDDVVDAFAAVCDGQERAVLGGASAGACLAAAAALRLHRAGESGPAGLVLAYGTFHAELPPIPRRLRMRLRGRYGLMQFRPQTVRRMNHNYAGTREAMRDPLAFPGGHDLTGLPPTLMLDADRDSLRASGEAFAAEAVAAGVAVDHRVIGGTTHGFLDEPASDGFGRGIAAIHDWLTAAAGFSAR